MLVVMVLFLTGCSTISHKNITTEWRGLGVNLSYRSQVAIPGEQIPLFIDAVNRLEKLLQEKN